ncbi:LPD29 domain-containing protein [Streptomyces sp. NPDC004647]|uniref:LPD29 domain-containing protein n=1 Tax=Streptomyces sp. NPDC004647 TaxID=3154671 RepID=UPI0033A103D9
MTWTDGPSEDQVDAQTGLFHGRRFNGMTDSHDGCGPLYLAFHPALPPVRITTGLDGLINDRSLSESVQAGAWQLSRVAGDPGR